MARRITVDFEDGSSHTYENVPDDMTPEVATQRAVQDFGKKVIRLDGGRGTEPPAGFLESTARDLVSSFGTAASLAPRAANYLMKAVPGGEPLSQGLNEVADSAESYWKGVGDKSTNNPWWQKAVRGVGGALATGPASVVNAAAGAGAGIGDQVAERMAEGKPNPLLRAAGNLAGGFLGGSTAALATRARPQTANVAREMLEGWTPEQLIAGQAYKNQQAAKDISIDLAQAMQTLYGDAKNLTPVRNFIAQHGQGNQVQASLRAQPEQLAREAELTVGSLPGTNYERGQNANNLQQVATGRLQQATQERKAVVDAMYEKAGALPEGASDELISLIRRDINKPGTTTLAKERGAAMIQQITGEGSEAAKQVNAARTALDSATTVTGRQQARAKLAEANAALNEQTGKALQAKDVSTWISELRGPYQGGLSLKQTHPREQGQLKGLAGQLNESLKDMSPDIAAADQAFRTITAEKINPLKQGVVGRLSQPGGYNPETQAMVSRFEGVMNEGVDRTAKVSQVRTAAKELANVDPDAFETAFKGWLSRKVQGNIKDSGAGEALQTADPATFAKKVFGDPLQWQGMKDAVATMAEIRGLPKDDLVRGLTNFRQLAEGMSLRPGAVGGLTGEELKRLGGASATANLVRVGTVLGRFGRTGEAIERHTLGKTLSQLDTILTSPEGAKMLIELGKVPVMSRKAQVILGTWGGAMGNTPGLSNSNPPEY